ncbi:MAG: PDZ domain-containing protein [Planctomycetes bacterium]|nr:PDZ domain-containing protein [Planctomycetota bacterium]
MKPIVAALALLLTLGAAARADTIRTKDGQRLEGEVVEETLDEVVLRTRYGVLVVPRAAIEAIEGAAQPAARAPEAPPLDLARVRVLHLKARRLAQRGVGDQALAAYAELLEVDPDDPLAHVEVGALRARQGDLVQAVASLRRAVLSGFADLERLKADERLKAVHEAPGFKQLLAQRTGLLRLAARKAPARQARLLRARGATADYREVRDEARQVVWLHALDDAGFAAVRAEVEAFVDAARREPFTKAPEGPLVVVLLPEQDRGAADTSYDPATHALTLGPLPFGAFARAPQARRELSRALHAADRQARQQAAHPAWLEEGLADLLSAATVEGERLAPRLAARVESLKDAPPLPELLTDARRRGLAARTLLHFLTARGALGSFYERVGAGAPLETALAEVVGPDAEPAWRAWLADQAAPALPFTGLATAATPRGLRATYVQTESGAARAGVMEGDVVTAVDGAPVRSEADLHEVLALRAVGHEVEVDLLRGEQPLRLRLTLGPRPRGPIGPLREGAPYLGVAVDQAAGGVVIRLVDADSPAAKAGLAPGDLLVDLDGAEVPTVRAWLRLLRQKQPGERAALQVERAGARRTVEVELAAAAGGS